MKTANDGGPAFPIDTQNQFPTQSGMSLRDWFAGMALVGLLAKYGNSDTAACEAFYQADVMLAEREKGK